MRFLGHVVSALGRPGEGQGSYDLGEIEAIFRYTRFLRTVWILQEVY